MESIIDNEREEAAAVERVPADRPSRAELAADRSLICPDVSGRDVIGRFEPGPEDPF